MEPKTKLKGAFERFSQAATQTAGSTPVFIIAVLVIGVWLISGPIFHFSNTWQLIINTLTSVCTFLMVFLIQKTQNKHSLAIQLKLNELVATHHVASNRLIDIEGLSEEDLRILTKHFSKLAQSSKSDSKINQSHSIEEAINKIEKKEGSEDASKKKGK